MEIHIISMNKKAQYCYDEKSRKIDVQIQCNYYQNSSRVLQKLTSQFYNVHGNTQNPE